MKETKTLSIKGYVFVEHGSSVECRLSAKKPVPVRYAFYGGGILTEQQVRERLRIMGVLVA